MPKQPIKVSPETLTSERGKAYGHPLVNFGATAHILNGVLGYKLNKPITTEDVALIMIGVKLARLAHDPKHADSLADIAGYVHTQHMVHNDDINLDDTPVLKEAQ